MKIEKQRETRGVRASSVRYIKLGAGGGWERECFQNGIIRLGFDSANPLTFDRCRDGRWDEVRNAFLAEGKSASTATRFTNETRLFFEDNGTTLWLTFGGDRLYWGFADGTPPMPHSDGHGTWRPLAGGWSDRDINGDVLSRDKLSGALTKLAAYRGTSCDVDVADYVIRRLNGQKTPEVEKAVGALEAMRSSTVAMMKLLHPKDFELLVDLVFTTSGWRRLGVIGKTQKTLDLDLKPPTTGERAFVQVKASTSQAELDEYVARFSEELAHFDRMFFVHHTGTVSCDSEGVRVIGAEDFAEMVVDAGLVRWLISKVA